MNSILKSRLNTPPRCDRFTGVASCAMAEGKCANGFGLLVSGIAPLIGIFYDSIEFIILAETKPILNGIMFSG